MGRYFYSGLNIGGTMSYLVYPGFLSRKQRGPGTCLGDLERRDRSGRSRSKNTYTATPKGSDGWRARRLPGIYNSRDEAADALVDYLSGYKYGRELLARIHAMAVSNDAAPFPEWLPTRPLKRRYSLPPGWPHGHKVPLSRLLQKRQPTSYEVLAEAEDWWEVRLDFAFDGAPLGKGGTSEIWTWRRGYGIRRLELSVS